MKTFKKLFLFAAMMSLAIYLSGCSKSAENEHLPEYCRSYSTFMETASPDLYELVDGINRYEYLNVISKIELEFEVNDPGREIDLDGIQCFQNLTSLSLSGVSFKDISEISALKNIQEITLDNTSVVSIDSLKNLSKVKSLTITDTKSLQSVKGVGDMTKLTKLELVGNGIVNIDELSRLNNLISLDLSDNEMEFFPSISGLESLETLNLSGNRIAGFGDDLSGLANVYYLNLSDNRISDLSKFDDLSNLVYLNLSNNLLGAGGASPNFASLAAATGLLELHLDNNGLTDISGLDDVNIPNLEELYLHENEISDIQYIASYNKLLVLTLNNNNLINIDNLSGMTGLSTIDLSNNSIVSFGGLINLSGLESINLFNNDITVIPNLQNSLPNLTSLDLSYNSLIDTSGIEGHQMLQSLNISNNGLETLKGLKEIPFLSELVLVDDVPFACTNDVEPTEFDCIPVLALNPNTFTRLEDSFVTMPSLTVAVTPAGTFNFDMIEFGSHLEIIGSFIDIALLTTIDFRSMGITTIDEHSFSSNHILSLLLDDNSFTDLRFALGNPNLSQLSIDNTNVNNLSILSGETTDDFANLRHVYASDINAPQELTNAFIDLPELAVVYLMRSNITHVTNSFNNLDQLSELIVSTTTITEIDNSFNNLFNSTAALGTVLNTIGMNSSNIESITDSFSNSLFEDIHLANQTPLSGSMTITNSFDDTTASNIYLSGSQIDTITSSFENTVINNIFDLSHNNITSIDDLSTTEMFELHLDNNELDTVSFIHDIDSITALDISTQRDDLSNITLTTIDGINNVPNLTTLLLDDLELHTIDGLKNIGLTAFDYQADEHKFIKITTISATSFENSLITNLNLEGHVLTNVDFLNNMPVLIDLTVFTDVGNLAYLTDAPYKDTLIYLYLGTPNSIDDFTPVQGFTLLDTFVFGSLSTTQINNLDNLPSLTNLNFVASDMVVSIADSFNTMGSLNVADTYLSSYTNLASVSNSFDMLTSSSFEMDGGLNVVDSFNNITGLEIHANGVFIPLVDSLSFDSLVSITINNPSYDTYAFLGNYPALTTVLIESPHSAIINGIESTSIQDLTINEITSMVFNIDVILPETATISAYNVVGELIIDTTSNNLVITSTGDVYVNSSAPEFNVEGTFSNLTVYAHSATSMVFGYLNVQNELNIYADNVETISDTVQQLPIADIVTVNSNTAMQTIVLQTPNLNIVNPLLSNVEASSTAVVDITTSEANLVVSGSGSTLFIDDPAMTNITHDISFANFTILASALAYVDFANSNITNYAIVSEVPSMEINGLSGLDITLVNNNLTTTNFNASEANISQTTSIPGSITLSGNLLSLDLTAHSVTEVIVDDAIIETFTLDSNAIAHITYIDSIVSDSSIISDVNTLEIDRISVLEPTRSDIFTNYILSTSNLTSLDAIVPNAEIIINSDATSLHIAAETSNLEFNASNVTTLSFTDTSTIDTVEATNTANLDLVVAGNAAINQLNISSSATSIDVSGNNTLATSITGDSFVSLIANLSDNDLNITTDKPSIMNMDIIAGDVFIQHELQTIILGNTSSIETLTIGSSTLTTFSSGIATIGTLNITDTATTMSVSGINILDANVTSNSLLNTLYVELDPTATFELTSTNSTTLNLTTTTESIVVNGDAAGEVIITSSTLLSADLTGNRVTLNISLPSFDLALITDLVELTINASGLNNVSITPTSNVSTLNLLDTNLSSIEKPGGSLINYLTVIDPDMISFEIIGQIYDTNLDTPNLSLFTKQGSLAIMLEVLTEAPAFALYGIGYDTIDLRGANLTGVDISNATGGYLVIETPNLATLDTDGYINDVITIEDAALTFDLITNATTVIFEGDQNTILSTTITNSEVVYMTASARTMNFIMLEGLLNLNAPNIENISGTIDRVSLAGVISTPLLTLNVTGDSFDVSADSNIQSIEFATATSLDTIDIKSDTGIVNTGNATITGITLSNVGASVDVTTLAEWIDADDLVSLIVDNMTNTDFTVTGEIDTLSVTGTALNSVSIADVTGLENLTLVNSNYIDLSFIPLGLFSTLQTISIDSLSPSNIASINTLLLNTDIILTSPIVDSDVVEYYRLSEVARLTSEETSSQVLHDAYYALALEEVVVLFNANSYMDFLPDIEVREDVTAGIVGIGLTKDVQYYFDKYMTEETIYTNEIDMRAAQGDIAVDAIYTAITNSLSSTILVDIDGIVFGNVSTSIQITASENSLGLALNKGWTISE